MGLWKRRNIVLNRDAYHERKIYWELDNTIVKFIKLREVAGRKWSNIVDELQSYNKYSSFKLVQWFPPETRWLKGNTDGVSKGNPGPSSFGFCVRD